MKTIVIGAGPVGALAAIYAAQRGHDVEVYELRNGKPFLAMFPHFRSLREIFNYLLFSHCQVSRAPSSGALHTKTHLALRGQSRRKPTFQEMVKILEILEITG
jgi:kynurenine 3-monooxygenase